MIKKSMRTLTELLKHLGCPYQAHEARPNEPRLCPKLCHAVCWDDPQDLPFGGSWPDHPMEKCSLCN